MYSDKQSGEERVLAGRRSVLNSTCSVQATLSANRNSSCIDGPQCKSLTVIALKSICISPAWLRIHRRS